MNVKLDYELDVIKGCYEMRNECNSIGMRKAAAHHDAEAEWYTSIVWADYERQTWGQGR